MMRGVFFQMVLSLAVAMQACGDETKGVLNQREEGPRLVALPDGALVGTDTSESDDAGDALTEPDLGGSEGDAASDSGDPSDVPTDAGPDTGAPNDASDTGSPPEDTNQPTDGGPSDVLPDAGTNGCQRNEDCPASPCHAGRCENGVCQEVTDDTATCTDNDPCTTGDRCVSGQCRGAGTLACSDGDPCTDDTCTSGVGCTTTPSRCDDQNFCTTDVCIPNVGCSHPPVLCPEITLSCTTSTCDPAIGCTFQDAIDGTGCDDLDGCTTGDACKDGECAGTPKTCDDGNVCTLDSCLPGGGCLSLPIPGCAADPQCSSRLAGTSCDDGSASTSADMCILGECAGFALTRIAGTTISGQQGLVLLETEFFSEQWWAVYWTLDGSLDTNFVLAKITNPSAPIVISNTLQGDAFTGLQDGFVGDIGGRLWRYSSETWTPDNGWDTAIKTSERGSFSNLFTARDLDASGNTGTRHLWAIGESDDIEWIRYCIDGNGSVVCSVQELDDFDDSSIPQAIAGTPICDSTGACEGFELVIGADAWAGGSYYNDTYENSDGTEWLWSQGRVPEDAANRTTEAVVGWGTGASSQYLVVGTNGYLVHRRTSGEWSNPLSLKDGQSNRDFYGAWEGAGVIVLGCTRPVSGGQLAFELWVAPSDSNVETGSNWTIHELTRSPAVNAAGLYDVHGRPSGEIRAVGALRRTSGAADWLDGAVWVRTP